MPLYQRLKYMEQDIGFEPMTFSLATRHSTTELILRNTGALYEIRTRVPAVKGRCHRPLDEQSKYLAERTGREPATLGVTGRYSNQLSYHSLILVKLFLGQHFRKCFR